MKVKQFVEQIVVNNDGEKIPVGQVLNRVIENYNKLGKKITAVLDYQLSKHFGFNSATGDMDIPYDEIKLVCLMEEV